MSAVPKIHPKIDECFQSALKFANVSDDSDSESDHISEKKQKLMFLMKMNFLLYLK